MESDRFMDTSNLDDLAWKFGEFLGDLTNPLAGIGGAGRKATILFTITFRDGKEAVCHGTAQEYKKILGWSMKDDKKAIRKEAKAAEKASKKAAR